MLSYPVPTPTRRAAIIPIPRAAWEAWLPPARGAMTIGAPSRIGRPNGCRGLLDVRVAVRSRCAPRSRAGSRQSPIADASPGDDPPDRVAIVSTRPRSANSSADSSTPDGGNESAGNHQHLEQLPHLASPPADRLVVTRTAKVPRTRRISSGFIAEPDVAVVATGLVLVAALHVSDDARSLSHGGECPAASVTPTSRPEMHKDARLLRDGLGSLRLS